MSEHRAWTYEQLRQAVAGGGIALRCRRRLQPAGGPGDKVFPPTYEGGKYAFEERTIEGTRVPCVLLDSVQSQANRMEMALREAYYEPGAEQTKEPGLPVVAVDFPGAELPEVGWITSLDAPHRIADAILRDSLLGEVKFRETDAGRAFTNAGPANATALLGICPTSLVFGLWDSTGPKGGLGTKIQRALVSEIVGVDAVRGVKTSSRIDPLGIELNAGPLFRRPDGDWTLDRAEAKKEDGRLVLFAQAKGGKDVLWDEAKAKGAIPDSGRPSKANHGNVTPTIDVRKDANGNDVYEEEPIALLREGSPVVAYASRKKPAYVGGVTISHALQTTTISLAALRRLRFPVDGRQANDEARAVLAALGLCAATLAQGDADLRSRCLLVPEEPSVWEAIAPDGQVTEFTLNAETAKALFAEAVAHATAAGLPWRREVLALTPSPQLVELVRRSRELKVAAADTEE